MQAPHTRVERCHSQEGLQAQLHLVTLSQSAEVCKQHKAQHGRLLLGPTSYWMTGMRQGKRVRVYSWERSREHGTLWQPQLVLAGVPAWASSQALTLSSVRTLLSSTGFLWEATPWPPKASTGHMHGPFFVSQPKPACKVSEMHNGNCSLAACECSGALTLYFIARYNILEALTDQQLFQVVKFKYLHFTDAEPDLERLRDLPKAKNKNWCPILNGKSSAAVCSFPLSLSEGRISPQDLTQLFLKVEKTKAHLSLPIRANSWLSCFLLPALHHLLVKHSPHDANHYALPSVPNPTVSAGIRHHPSFLIPTPSYFQLHHTYVCVGYFSPSVSHLDWYSRNNQIINNILSLLALYKLFIWACPSKTACYCFSNKYHCSWKTNAHMAAPQRKTCKYRILEDKFVSLFPLSLWTCSAERQPKGISKIRYGLRAQIFQAQVPK